MKKLLISFYLKYKLFIFPTVVTLSCLILLGFIIVPQLLSLVGNQGVAEDLLDKSKFLETKAQTLKNYDEMDLKRKVDALLVAYPTDKDFANVLQVLQNITSKYNFVITNFSLGGGNEALAGSQSYGVKIDILGPKDFFSLLLKEIESSTRVMRVGSINISQSKDTQSIDAGVTVLVLYSAAPTAFGNVDTELPEISASDEEIIAKLSANLGPAFSVNQQPTVSIPTGKANPFE